MPCDAKDVGFHIGRSNKTISSEKPRRMIPGRNKMVVNEIHMQVSSNPANTHFGVEILSGDHSTYMSLKLPDVYPATSLK